jgi:hypothetical protein
VNPRELNRKDRTMITLRNLVLFAGALTIACVVIVTGNTEKASATNPELCPNLGDRHHPVSIILGENFGFADVNTGCPDDPEAPAYPSTKAMWAGTCDLGSDSTSHGGIGTAPTSRLHCIDMGTHSVGSGVANDDSPWPIGGEPSWRLDPVAQAGAHPDGTAAFFFNYQRGSRPDGQVKNIIVALPPGVVGNPEAVPKCPAILAQATPPQCEQASQVGMNTIGFAGNLIPNDFLSYPLYNIEARDTITAEFLIGFVGRLFNVPITARGRTNGDYGLDTLALLIPNYVGIGGQQFTFWGVPWSEAHDLYRVDGTSLAIEKGADYVEGNLGNEHYDPEWGPIKPFLTNSTECTDDPAPLLIDIDQWADPVSGGGSFTRGTVLTDPLTGCDQLDFSPAITLHPDVNVADSPSGLDVELSIPQNNDPPASVATNPADDTGAPAYWKTPAGRATAHLKDTTIHLPQGTSFNPAAADGLRCSAASTSPHNTTTPSRAP